MKNLIFLAAITFGFTFTSCNGEAQDTNPNSLDTSNKIEVIDFHSTHRCMTCNAIEANTRFTLDTYFANELESGLITFQTVNVDDEENYGIAEKFEAAGTALFLNVIVNGVETSIDLTEFAFMNGNEKDVFSKELKVKLDDELKNF